MVFEHGLTEACLYKDVFISGSHIFAGGTQEWWGRCHLPSKSACGPHEDLRHHKCATSLCLHRPQAAVVQRSAGQNNGAVSIYHHTLKMVRKKRDWNWIPDCLVPHSLYVLSGPAIGNATSPPPAPFFTSIKCKEWLKVLLLPSRQGSALEKSWCSFKLWAFPKVYIFLSLSYHCYTVIQLKEALNTSHKADTAYYKQTKQLEHLFCWESRQTHWHFTNCHYYKKRQETSTYTKCSLPHFQSSFQFFLRGHQQQ